MQGATVAREPFATLGGAWLATPDQAGRCVGGGRLEGPLPPSLLSCLPACLPVSLGLATASPVASAPSSCHAQHSFHAVSERSQRRRASP